MAKLYILLLFVCFGGGAYFWWFNNARTSTVHGDASERTEQVLVKVGDQIISQSDLDFEFEFQTEGLIDPEQLTPIPDTGENPKANLAELKRQLLSELVERKVLFSVVRTDSQFKASDKSRYIDCERDLQNFIDSGKTLEKSDLQRFKSRLCEKSILGQYLAERLFREVDVTDAEILAYYKDNVAEFQVKESVTIRQVVLASERDAKRVRGKLRRDNFAEIATEYSITPEAENGGLLGPFARGQMPRALEIAFRMRKGQISDIQKSTYGFHLIMLVEKQKERTQSLEEASQIIESRLRRQKEELVYRQWVEEALAIVRVEGPKPLW